MATSVYLKTADEFKALAQKHPRVLVSYSGGKDSSVCLDLAMKADFQEVVPFFMYLVPGISFVEKQIDYARSRYGLKVLQVPHWLTFKYARGGIFCDVPPSFYDLPEINLFTIYEMVMHQTGIPIVINGGKKSDGLWRKRFIWSVRNKACLQHPIQEWNKWDVMAYLKSNGIPVAKDSLDMGAKGAGVGLHPTSLLWIYDNHPEDFKKIEKVFPYARAAVYRREWYGIGKDYRHSRVPESA